MSPGSAWECQFIQAHTWLKKAKVCAVASGFFSTQCALFSKLRAESLGRVVGCAHRAQARKLSCR